MPQALGMVAPIAPIGTSSPGQPPHTSNTQEVEEYNCEYNVHTHDYSGLVHVEDVNLPQSTTPPAYATLQSLLDVWSATLDASTGLNAGGSTLQGQVSIYVGQPVTRVQRSGSRLVVQPSCRDAKLNNADQTRRDLDRDRHSAVPRKRVTQGRIRTQKLARCER